MEEFWVQGEHGESKILTLGHNVHNYQNLENENIFIIIPGNPGLAGFYVPFMNTIDALLDDSSLTIWTISHLGIESRNPSYFPIDPTYDLHQQIDEKIALIEKLVPPTAKITFIGHSIGCKMILELLSRNKTHTFKDIYLLFPTIENMASTTRGKETLPLVTTYKPFALLLLVFMNILLPEKVLKWLISCTMEDVPDKPILEAVATLVNPNFINNCFSLASHELQTVLDLQEKDFQTLQQQATKLRLYYAAEDGWVPLEYRTNLLGKVPQIQEKNARICTRGIPHAFVERHSELMAEILTDWMKEEL